MTFYTALLWQEAGHEVAVTVPDFPGFATSAPKLEEVESMAVVGLTFHIQSLIKAGEEIPGPTPIDDAINKIMEDPEYEGAQAFLLSVPTLPEKHIPCNLTLPESLVRFIDEAAKTKSTTRSGYIKDLAARDLQII